MPGWNDADFKANFHLSSATFAYLVNKLQPALQRQELFSSTISVDHCVVIAGLAPCLLRFAYAC